MRTIPVILICLGAVLVLGAAWFWSVPLMGDAGTYSYSSARWISENGMQPIPAGSHRGEQAQGHPPLYFWLWALMMKLFGNTLMTAKILPTLAAAMALAGAWRLASTLSSDRLAGVMAAAGLLASPLFLAQAFRPLPDTACAAAAAWSLYHFAQRKYLTAALLCVLAVQFREQGILLAGGLLIADLISERRIRSRMLLWLLPVFILIGNYLLNLIVNGFFIDPRHLAEAGDIHASGNVVQWLGFFGGHLLGEDFRWFPVCIVIAVMLAGSRAKLNAPVGVALLAPVLFHDRLPLAYILTVSALYAWFLVARRRLPSPAVAAVILFCMFMVLFFSLMPLISPDPPHDLFRYLLAVYPGMMALLAARLLATGRRIAIPVWGVFIVGALLCFGAVRPNWQAEDSPMGQVIATRTRAAIAVSGNPYTVRTELLTDPALGFVDAPRPFEDGERGQLVVTCQEGVDRIPEGYILTRDTLYHWTYDLLSVSALEIAPTDLHAEP